MSVLIDQELAFCGEKATEKHGVLNKWRRVVGGEQEVVKCQKGG